MGSNITDFSAVKFLLLVFLIIILSIEGIKAQQDPIDHYDGIPLVVYSWRWPLI